MSTANHKTRGRLDVIVALSGLVLLWAALYVARPLAQVYEEVPFRQALADRVIAGVGDKTLRPDNSGRVILPPTLTDASKSGVAYVTWHRDGGFALLLPSYLDHEADGFRGYAFVPQAHLAVGNAVQMLGPARAVPGGPRSRWVALLVDDRLAPDWYRVHGVWR